MGAGYYGSERGKGEGFRPLLSLFLFHEYDKFDVVSGDDFLPQIVGVQLANFARRFRNHWLVSSFFEERYDVCPTRDDSDGALVAFAFCLGHVHQLLAEALALVVGMHRQGADLRHSVVRDAPHATDYPWP